MSKSLIKNKRPISLLLSILSLAIVFIGGFFSSNTKLEKIAEYATEVVKEHTNGKSLCALTVEKTSESGSIIDSDSEFHNLYGTFKQQKITFASTINADKRHSIAIENIASDNLSMLYVGPVGSVPYEGHYKHYTLPIEIMFADEKIDDISKYIVYISQSHAYRLLEKQSVPKQPDGSYSYNDYETLLKTLIAINIDGNSRIFAIQNIYYQSNYYFDGLNEVMGDFVMVSYYLPDNLRDEQQNMYFMSDYTYQNKYFMNYINNAYPSKTYLVKVNRFNLIDAIDETYLTSFYYSNITKSDWAFALLLTVSIILLVASLICFHFEAKSRTLSWFYLALRTVSIFVPYIIFLIAFRISGNVLFFSETSTKTTVWMIVCYVLLMSLMIVFAQRKKNPLFVNMEAYYELNI